MKKVMRGKGIKIISVFWATILVLGMFGCAEKEEMAEAKKLLPLKFKEERK